MTATLSLPRMRPDQWRIIQHPAKIKVLTMGRRWGKTVTGGAVALATASQGGSVAWCAPVFKNTRPLWRMVERTLAPLSKAGLVKLNKSELSVHFHNGGFLSIYSMDNHESILGEAFNLVILDECARIAPEAWFDSIMPTLADNDGEAILISTPKGLNWFHDFWLQGKRDGKYIASFQAPTSDNPLPNIQEAFNRIRPLVPERTYRQEWLAEFVDNEGVVFRNVRECVYGQATKTREDGKSYAIGVDLAKKLDYTVLTVICLDDARIVEIQRFHHVEYVIQLNRLSELVDKYRPSNVIIETNNTGDLFIEQARRQIKARITGFTTKNDTKHEIIDRLVLAFERQEISIPDDDVLIGELLSYEAEALSGGNLRYNAPSGKHDDCVMSLAFAYYALKRTIRNFETINF